MLYKEYFFVAGYLLSFVLFIIVFVFYNKNRVLKKKYGGIIDAEKAAQNILSEFEEMRTEFEEMRNNYKDKKHIYDDLLDKISIAEDKVEYIEMGFGNIDFEFNDVEAYKEAIIEIKSKQKEMAKNKIAVVCFFDCRDCRVNGSILKGKRMINENIKATLRAFNNECDVIINHVTWKNYSQSRNKILKSCEFYNNYNKTLQIIISDEYLKLKLEELRLNYENQEKKQQIKEEQRAIREQIREEERFERDRIAAEKEEEKYKKLLKKAQEEAQKASGQKLTQLNEEVEKLAILLKEAEEKNQRAISMAQQTKAGHVYIISNIGSFGADVFKIGMTRRLDPYERVYELGGASVPFEFDVHAMIPCNDAPSLENKLHKAFEKYKMNLVNNRREFFKVSLNEIENQVKRENPKSEFIRTALAEQYRKSEALRKQRQEAASLPVDKQFPNSL